MELIFKVQEWLKNWWNTIWYHTQLRGWPERMPDWFIRHKVRCEGCGAECDVVHIPPKGMACMDGFYCKKCEPSTILKG